MPRHEGSAVAEILTNRVKVSDGHFVDAQDGRVLMFRGKGGQLSKPNPAKLNNGKALF